MSTEQFVEHIRRVMTTDAFMDRMQDMWSKQWLPVVKASIEKEVAKQIQRDRADILNELVADRNQELVETLRKLLALIAVQPKGQL